MEVNFKIEHNVRLIPVTKGLPPEVYATSGKAVSLPRPKGAFMISWLLV